MTAIPYEAMSKSQLVEVAKLQQAKLQRLYSLLAIPNAIFAPGEKLAQWAAQDVLANQKPDENGLARINIGAIAESIGMSPETVSRYVKNICERTNATREVKPYTTKNGQEMNLVYVKPDEPVWAAPTTVTPTPEKLRNLPGDKRRCSCGGKLRIKERVLRSQQYTVCEECGEQKTYQPRDVYQPLAVNSKLKEASEEGLQLAEPFGEPENLTVLNCLHSSSSGDASPLLAELKVLPIWACHHAKRPYNAKTDYAASSTDPTTWSPYEQAQAKYERSQAWASPYDGIGFMCNGEYTVIDQDHCIQDGVMSDQAQTINARINSYGEISYSGTGEHIITRGSIPKGVKRKGIEMYCKDRFIVFTGNHLPGTPLEIKDCQATLDALYTELVPTEKEAQPIKDCVSAYLFSDEQVLAKAYNGANGARFQALWNGSIAPYASQSEADLALCNELAYRSDNDVEMIDRLFRQSGLMRDKWDKKHGGETYGERTIRLALVKRLAS